MVPQLTRVAIMYNPNSVPIDGTFFFRPFISSRRFLSAAHHRGSARSVRDRNCHHETWREFGSAILVPDNFMSVHRDLIISLTAQFRIPAIYPYRYFAEAGGSCRTAWMP